MVSPIHNTIYQSEELKLRKLGRNTQFQFDSSNLPSERAIQQRYLVELKCTVKFPRETVFDILSGQHFERYCYEVEPFACKAQVITFTPCCFNLIQPEGGL